MNKNEALKKIDELKKFVEQCDQNEEFVTIDYSVIPKEKFEKYGVKPFQVAKKKARREDGTVWNNIDFEDAKKEAEKMGGRLMSLNEIFLLLDAYKEKYLDNASCEHEEFLGIEELSYHEEVCYEWIDSLSVIPFILFPDSLSQFSIFGNSFGKFFSYIRATISEYHLN